MWAQGKKILGKLWKDGQRLNVTTLLNIANNVNFRNMMRKVVS